MIRSIVLLFALSISFEPTNVQASDWSKHKNNVVCGLVNLSNLDDIISDLAASEIEFGEAFANARCISNNGLDGNPITWAPYLHSLISHQDKPRYVARKIMDQLLEENLNSVFEFLVIGEKIDQSLLQKIVIALDREPNGTGRTKSLVKLGRDVCVRIEEVGMKKYPLLQRDYEEYCGEFL